MKFGSWFCVKKTTSEIYKRNWCDSEPKSYSFKGKYSTITWFYKQLHIALLWISGVIIIWIYRYRKKCSIIKTTLVWIRRKVKGSILWSCRASGLKLLTFYRFVLSLLRHMTTVCGVAIVNLQVSMFETKYWTRPRLKYRLINSFLKNSAEK